MKNAKIAFAIFMLLCVLLPVSSLAAIPASPMEAFYVNDFADVISASDADEMIMIGQALEDACGAQVVATTVNFLDGLDIEEYAVQLFNKWGIGQADKNDGVLILLSIGDREIWTVSGMGLEDEMTASVVSSYHDEYALPYFAEDDYSKGMLEDYRAHCEKVASVYGVRLNETSGNGASSADGYSYSYNYSYDTGGGAGIMGAIFAIVILLIIFSIIRSAFRGVGRVARPRRFGWFGRWGWPGGWVRSPRPPRPPRVHAPPPPPRGHGSGGFGSFKPSSGPRTGGGGSTRGGGGGRSFGGSSGKSSFGGSSSSGRSFGGGSRSGGRSGGGGSTRGGGGGRKF